MTDELPLPKAKRQKVKSKANDDLGYKRVDTTLHLCDQNLVGFKVKIYWPADDKYYPGVIQSYDDAAKEHTVHYDDDTEEVLILAAEQVQLPSSYEMPLLSEEALCNNLIQLIYALDAKGKRIRAEAEAQRNGKGRPTKDDLENIQRYDSKAADLRGKLAELRKVKHEEEKVQEEKVRCLEPDWRFNTARMDESWKRSLLDLQAAQRAGKPVDATKLAYLELYANFDNKRLQHQFFKWIDVALTCAPEALVTRRVSMWWEHGDGSGDWYPGVVTSYNPVTCQHTVDYDDGTTNDVVWIAKEKVMLQTQPGEVFAPPRSEDVLRMADCMEKAAQEILRSPAGLPDGTEQLDLTDADNLRKNAARIRNAATFLQSEYPALPLQSLPLALEPAPSRSKPRGRSAALKHSPLEHASGETGVHSSTSTNTSVFPPLALHPTPTTSAVVNHQMDLQPSTAPAFNTLSIAGNAERTSSPSAVTSPSGVAKQMVPHQLPTQPGVGVPANEAHTGRSTPPARTAPPGRTPRTVRRRLAGNAGPAKLNSHASAAKKSSASGTNSIACGTLPVAGMATCGRPHLSTVVRETNAAVMGAEGALASAAHQQPVQPPKFSSASLGGNHAVMSLLAPSLQELVAGWGSKHAHPPGTAKAGGTATTIPVRGAVGDTVDDNTAVAQPRQKRPRRQASAGVAVATAAAAGPSRTKSPGNRYMQSPSKHLQSAVCGDLANRHGTPRFAGAPAASNPGHASHNGSNASTGAVGFGSLMSCAPTSTPLQHGVEPMPAAPGSVCNHQGLTLTLTLPDDWVQQHPYMPRAIELDTLRLPPDTAAALKHHLISICRPGLKEPAADGRPGGLATVQEASCLGPSSTASPNGTAKKGVNLTTGDHCTIYSYSCKIKTPTAGKKTGGTPVKSNAHDASPAPITDELICPKGFKGSGYSCDGWQDVRERDLPSRAHARTSAEEGQITLNTQQVFSSCGDMVGLHGAAQPSVGDASNANNQRREALDTTQCLDSSDDVVIVSERDSCPSKRGQTRNSKVLSKWPTTRGRKRKKLSVSQCADDSGTSPLQGVVRMDIEELDPNEESKIEKIAAGSEIIPAQQQLGQHGREGKFLPLQAVIHLSERELTCGSSGVGALALCNVNEGGCTVSETYGMTEFRLGREKNVDDGAVREQAGVLSVIDSRSEGHHRDAEGMGCERREQQLLEELLSALTPDERDMFNKLKAELEQETHRSGGTWISDWGPGQVLWVSTSKFPYWPALVLSRLEAENYHSSSQNRAMLSVKFFASYDIRYIRYSQLSSSVLTFPEGVLQGKLKPKTGATNLFVAALEQAKEYMQTGSLPEQMTWAKLADDDDSVCNKEPFTSQDLAGKLVQRKKGPGMMPVGARNSWRGVGMSKGRMGRKGSETRQKAKLQQGTLRVLEFGQVEYLNPTFHDEHAIFPVGYCAERLLRDPEDQLMRLEIGGSSDGLLPCFRIFNNDKLIFEGSCLNQAWSHVVPLAPSCQKQGLMRMFGLNNPSVVKHLLSLPGANKCDRFAGLEQCEPLDEEEMKKRKELSARSSKLGPGLWPVRMGERIIGVCDICGQEDEYEDDLVIECDRCRVAVHMQCYGVSSPPDGRLWLCDVCSLGVKPEEWPACALCPVIGGAMKRSNDWKWCHMMCAMWIPETHYAQNTIRGLDKIRPARMKLKCSLCHQQHGVCIQCTASQHCYTAFHPMCARQHKLPMICREGEKRRATPIKPGFRSPGPRVPSVPDQTMDDVPTTTAASHAIIDLTSSPSTPEAEVPPLKAVQPSNAVPQAGPTQPPTAGASAGVSHEQPTGHVTGAGSAKSSKPASSESMLQCFCLKHRQHKPKEPFHYLHVHPTAIPSPLAKTAPNKSIKATKTAAPQEWRPEAADGCARSRPYNEALRRGLREPEVLAAAMQKRFFVQPMPYICTAALRRQQELPESFCHDPTPEEADTICPAWFTPPACLPQDVVLHQDARSIPGPSSTAPAPTTTLAVYHAVTGAPATGPHTGTNRRLEEQEKFYTMTDRYLMMKESVGRRITSGKSAIHGWGAFTKVHHKAGDMVVEYVGELVRPSVADRREQRTYNTLVGAGTYIFRLNDQWNVDATKAGNIAHLLNHSCDPNCRSRTIPTVNPATGLLEEHVVIFAEKDIPPGTELTYDYRFAGEEQLVCNCGAAKCRGFVNVPENSHGIIKVHRKDLKPVSGQSLASRS